jgi:hypothetical protein
MVKRLLSITSVVAFVSASIPADAELLNNTDGSTAERVDEAADSTDNEPIPLLLFTTQYASDGEREGWFAVPVACVDASGAFVANPATCAEATVEGALLYGADSDEQLRTQGALVDLPDRYERGLQLVSEPVGDLFYSLPLDTAPPRPDCRPLRAGLNVRSMQPDELARVGASVPLADSAAAALNQPWVASSFLEGDLDGDGQRDRLLGHRFESDEISRESCEVVVGVWGDAETGPTVVDASCEGPTEWTLSERFGPFNLSQSTCWDLNRDGRVELWLSTGFDSMRGYEFVEVRDRRLVRVGGTIWLGD